MANDSDHPDSWRAAAAESDEITAPTFYETVQIEMLPGGRARLDSDQDSFVVEMQLHPLTRRRRSRRSRPSTSASWNIFGADVTEVRFVARDRKRIDPIPAFSSGLVYGYFVALTHYLDSLSEHDSRRELLRRAPQHGKPTDSRFYPDLLRREAQIRARGSTTPSKDLAALFPGTPPATVRSWLKRAREIEQQQSTDTTRKRTTRKRTSRRRKQ